MPILRVNGVEMCSIPGCSRKAEWTGKILVYPQGVPASSFPPLDFWCSIRCCKEHIEGKIETLAKDNRWRQLARHAFLERRSMEPNLDRLEIKLVRVTDPEYNAYRRRAEQ